MNVLSLLPERWRAAIAHWLRRLCQVSDTPPAPVHMPPPMPAGADPDTLPTPVRGDETALQPAAPEDTAEPTNPGSIPARRRSMRAGDDDSGA